MRHCLQPCQSSFHYHTVVSGVLHCQIVFVLGAEDTIGSWKRPCCEILSCQKTASLGQCLAGRAIRMHLEAYTKEHCTMAIRHLLCSSKGMLLTGFCSSSRHKPQPSGMSMDGLLSCVCRPVGSRSWMISVALSLNASCRASALRLLAGPG